jgi:hypothetical protein
MLLLTLISIALVFLLLKAAIYLFVAVWNKVEKKR